MKGIKKIKGGGHRTSDSEFANLETQFKTKYKHLEEVQKDVTSFMTSLDKMLTEQRLIATNLKQMTGVTPGGLGGLLQKEHEINVTLIEERRTGLGEDIKAHFTEPYHAYMNQYREIRDRIKERNRREDEVGTHQSNISKFRGKGDVRLNSEQTRLDACIPAYNELNAELKIDISNLLLDTDVFFLPLMTQLFQLQTQFYGHIYNRKNENVPLNGENLTVLPVKLVITPREKSSISKQYMTANSNPYANSANNPYNTSPPLTNSPPSYQQQQPPQQQYNAAPAPYGQPAAGPYGHPQQGGYAGYPPQQQQQQPAYHAAPQTYAAPLPPPPPVQSNVKMAQGLWDFTASAPHELSFRAGDMLKVLDSSSAWWQAELNGRQGSVPGNYLKML